MVYLRKTHAVLELKPACNVVGSSWSFYFTYCFENAAVKKTPSLDYEMTTKNLTEQMVQGTTHRLANLWKILDGDRHTTFNTADSCPAIAHYQAGPMIVDFGPRPAPNVSINAQQANWAFASVVR